MQSTTKIPIESIQKRIANMKPLLVFLKVKEINGLIKPIVYEMREVINYSRGNYETQIHEATK
jgi:hypothetical protein